MQSTSPSLAGICLLLLFPILLSSQSDPLQREVNALKKASHDKLSISFEERTRWEERFGVNFGKAVKQQDMLSRIRVGATYKPNPWLTLSSTGQDARTPFYGLAAPSTMRESMDLQEAWAGLSKKSLPVSFSFGRRMLNYGETRVIGVPQWSNTARTYDYGRLQFTRKHLTLDALLISPVIIRTDSFNNPEFGNRYWGAYAVLSKYWRNQSMDAYALRHAQNKIGGWTGTGTLGTNNYGMRFYGPLPAKFSYSLEGIGQNGHMGLQNQRAFAFYTSVARTVPIGPMPLAISLEYKGASGSHTGASHSATFDQLTPANHDKFGHQDLFGWRNLKTFKNLDTLNVTKALAVNLMYTDHYLFSSTDALYNSSGSKISSSSTGAPGSHVGRELDAFGTWTIGNHTLLAGYGQFFRGAFVQQTTPGLNPRYIYFAQQYTLK